MPMNILSASQLDIIVFHGCLRDECTSLTRRCRKSRGLRKLNHHRNLETDSHDEWPPRKHGKGVLAVRRERRTQA